MSCRMLSCQTGTCGCAPFAALLFTSMAGGDWVRVDRNLHNKGTIKFCNQSMGLMAYKMQLSGSNAVSPREFQSDQSQTVGGPLSVRVRGYGWYSRMAIAPSLAYCYAIAPPASVTLSLPFGSACAHGLRFGMIRCLQAPIASEQVLCILYGVRGGMPQIDNLSVYVYQGEGDCTIRGQCVSPA